MQSLKIGPLSVLGRKQVFSEVADKGTPTIMTRLWKYITRLWKYKHNLGNTKRDFGNRKCPTLENQNNKYTADGRSC